MRGLIGKSGRWRPAALGGALVRSLQARRRAEGLADAIALAYRTNPTLQAQRAQQRELDETYVVARTGFRPTASVTASTGYSRTDYGLPAG